MEWMEILKWGGLLISIYISVKIALIAFNGIKGIDNKNDHVVLPD